MITNAVVIIVSSFREPWQNEILIANSCILHSIASHKFGLLQLYNHSTEANFATHIKQLFN